MQELEQGRSRCRECLNKESALVNQVRGALLEEGIAISQGIAKLRARVLEDAENGLHDLTRLLIHDLSKQLKALDERISDYDNQIQELANNDGICRLLITIPGIGPFIATALRAAVGDPTNFRSGRHLSAWLRLVPRQNSTGDRTVLLGISKRGYCYVRTVNSGCQGSHELPEKQG